MKRYRGLLSLTLVLFISNLVSGQTVGIGTSTFVPTAMLEIHGSGATSATKALHIENSSASAMVTVLNNGNVGIGTATPYQNVHIYGTAAGDMGPRLYIMNSAGGAGAEAAIDFGSYDPGAANDPTARISATDNNWSSHITFSTKAEGANTNSLVEHMRVTSGGNVGIGTTTVDQKLHVHGNVNVPTSTTSVGVIMSNNSRYIHNFGTQNFFAGVNAGRLNAGATGEDNIGIGYNALSAYTTGTANTIIGSGAGAALTASNQNTAIGYGALAAITTNVSSSNTAIGYIALAGTSTVGYNTAIGHSALSQGNTGGYNTAVGWYALRQNGAGTANVAIGEQALTGNTAGNHNVAIGSSALLANTDGEYNIAFGRQSQWKTTTGDQNISIGTTALYNNTTGSSNVMIGNQTAYEAKANNVNYNIGIGEGAQYFMGASSNIGIGYYAVRGDATSGITGSNNIGLGESTLRIASSADNNIAIGKYALISHTTGDNNVAIGVEAAYSGAGKENVTGSNNTFIGTYAGPTANNLTNATAIGYNAAVGASNSLVLGASANVGIGTASPAALLEVVSSDGSRGGIQINNTSTGYSSLRVGDNTGNYGELFLTPAGNAAGWPTSTTILSGSDVGDLILYAKTAKAMHMYTGGSERMTILSAGNVGIGTTSPADALHIYRNSASGGGLKITNAGAGYTQIQLADNTTTNNEVNLLMAVNGNCCWPAGTFVLDGSNNGDIVLYAEASRAMHMYTGATEHMTILSGGNVGIGSTNPGVKLDVAGSVNCTGGTCSSDFRFKKNIQPLNNSLLKINQLQGVSYLWKTNEFPDRNFSDKEQIGFIAQDVEKIIPQLVVTMNDGYKAMDYEKLTAVLVEALKELNYKVDTQQKYINELNDLLNNKNKNSLEANKTENYQINK